MKNSQSGFAHILLLLIIVVALGGGAYYYIQSQNKSTDDTVSVEVKKFDDSALAISLPTVAAADNASIELQSLQNVLTPAEATLIKDYIAAAKPSTSLTQKIKSMLATKADIFATIDRAVAKPKYLCDVGSQTCSLTNYRNLASLIAVQADVFFKDGKIKEAMDVAFKGLDLTQKIEDGTTSHVDYLIALSMKTTLLTEIKTITAADTLSASDKTEFLAKLAKYTDDSTSLKNATKYAYKATVRSIDVISSGDTSGVPELDKEALDTYIEGKKDHAWNPKATKAMFYQFYKKMLDNIDLACGSTYESAEENIDIESLDPKDPNYVGKIFYATGTPSLDGINNKRCELVPLYESIKAELSQ
jgi:uncharacterized protein (UPF0333 family)